jgi:hypothetical protein
MSGEIEVGRFIGVMSVYGHSEGDFRRSEGHISQSTNAVSCVTVFVIQQHIP